MGKICLVLLIGLPGAGKTTFCKALVGKLNTLQSYKTYIIEYDEIFKQNVDLSGNNRLKYMRKLAYASTEKILKSIKCSETKYKMHVIFVDDNMFYKSMRYEYYKLAREYTISFLQIYLKITVDDAIRQNNVRDPISQIPETVIIDMESKFEEPGQENWESNLLVLNAPFELGTEIFNDLTCIMERSCEHPVTIAIDPKTGTLPISRLQNIELLLRKIVHSKLIKDKTQSLAYIMKKKEILKAIKCGMLTIDHTLNLIELYNYLASLFEEEEFEII